MVQFRGEEYMAVKEGLAYILNPISNLNTDGREPPPKKQKLSKLQDPKISSKEEGGEENGDQSKAPPQSVFYNPIQQFNRDLSVLAIRAFGEGFLEERKQKAERAKRRSVDKRQLKAKKRKCDQGDEGVTAKDDAHVNRNGVASEKQDLPMNVDNEFQDQNDPKSDVTVRAGADETVPSDSKDLGQKQSSLTQSSFTILDALSATGLRALRYAKEIPFVSRVVANDLSSTAINSIKINVAYNEVEASVQPNLDDARSYMYRISASRPPPRFQGRRNGSQGENHITKFDVIDLDPYGTAAPFFDAAVQSVSNGGLLCVTCTDAGVFASAGYLEKTWALYGGAPMKGPNCHEAGLRLILNGIASSAARYGLAIEPLLSLSIDFYARVFVRIHESPAQVKFASGNTMLVYNCDSGCGAWKTQAVTTTRMRQNKNGEPFYHYASAQGPTAAPQCEHCGFRTHLAGPMWAGPLHNPHFINTILDKLPDLDRSIYQTVERIEGMLTTALEEDLDIVWAVKDENIEVDTITPRPMDVSSPIIPRTDPALRDPYPFFISPTAMSKVIHAATLPINALHSALSSLGYRFTRSHTKPNSIRTDAPWDVLWEIMREWVRQKSPLKEGTLSRGSPGAAIMRKSRDPSLQSAIDDVKASESDKDERLTMLKEDVKSALESATNVHELTIQLEAALYRSGSRQPVGRTKEPAADSTTANSTTPPPPTSITAPRILSQLEISFEESLGDRANAIHSNRRVIRYQMNPRANWGPLTRAR